MPAGLDPNYTAPSTNTGGIDWGKLIGGGISGGSIIALMTMLAKFIDDQRGKETVSPLETLTGNQNKGITGVQPTTAGYKSMLDNTMAGNVSNPNLAQAQQIAGANLSRPVNAPAAFNPYGNQGYGKTDPQLMSRMMGFAKGNNANTQISGQTAPPATFNPYANNQGYGKIDPLLMSKMMEMAMGKNQNPIVNQGNQFLMGSMQNRFKPRPLPGQTGQVTGTKF